MVLTSKWRRLLSAAAAGVVVSFGVSPARTSEANLILPPLDAVSFHGVSGRAILLWGLLVCAAGLVFGLVIYRHLKRLPVLKSMLEVSELIYATCKTYLRTQGKFTMLLWG